MDINYKIKYKIRNSKRAKRMSITVHTDRSVIVTAPIGVKENSIKRFVTKHSIWIFKSINSFPIIEDRDLATFTKSHYKKNKERARKLINERLKELNERFRFEYNRVSIRNQRTVWGSCTSKGNLNFNYKLIFQKPEIMDYVLIHELCHLKELNHTNKFWNLVGEACPNYKRFKKILQKKLY